MAAHPFTGLQVTWKLSSLRSRTLLRTFFLAALVGGLWSQPSNAQFPGVTLTEEFTVRAEFKFKPGTYGIALPVTLNGQTNLFLLDTATALLVFDDSFRSLLGQKLGLVGVPSHGDLKVAEAFAAPPAPRDPISLEKELEAFAAPLATLGPLSLQTPEPVLCDSLEPMRRLTGTDFRGVLGTSFLRRYVEWLDFDKGRVVFMERRAPAAAGHPLTNTNHLALFIMATLPTGEKPFRLDSGASVFGCLAPEIFDELVRSNALKVIGTEVITTTGGEQLVRKGRLNRFEYGGRIYHDAVFFRSAPTSLGWEFLTNYNWLLDWPQERTGFVLRTSEKKQPQ
jgi:hypothetical protein